MHEQDSDSPVAGYYMGALVRGGPKVALRIYYGLPVIDGEEQDRSPRWLVDVAGETDFVETGDSGYRCRVVHDVYRYWPYCGRFPISEGDYKFLIENARWAKTWAPERPEAAPTKKFNLRGKSVF